MWYLENTNTPSHPTPHPHKNKKQKKTPLYISSEPGFCFHSKKARFLFRVKLTLRFCQENMFLHLSPLTIHQLFFSFEKGNDSARRKGLWKSLIWDWKYEKTHCGTLCLLDNQHITDEYLTWEYLKYEIQKFTRYMQKP